MIVIPKAKPLVFPNYFDKSSANVYDDSHVVKYARKDFIVEDEFDSQIIFFAGRRRAGKTSTAVWWAEEIKQANKELCNVDLKVMCNFKNVLADVCDKDLLLNAMDLANPDIHDCILIIDEVQAAFPSNRSMRNISNDLNTFLEQIRKKNVSIIMATQFPHMIDSRFLYQVDFFVKPERKRVKGIKIPYVKIRIFDFWDQHFDNVRVKRKKWPLEDHEADKVKLLYTVDSVFGKYNTKEVIPSLLTPNRKAILEQQNGYDLSSLDERNQETLTAKNVLHEQIASGDPNQQKFLNLIPFFHGAYPHLRQRTDSEVRAFALQEGYKFSQNGIKGIRFVISHPNMSEEDEEELTESSYEDVVNVP